MLLEEEILHDECHVPYPQICSQRSYQPFQRESLAAFLGSLQQDATAIGMMYIQ